MDNLVYIVKGLKGYLLHKYSIFRAARAFLYMISSSDVEV
jgi:hypothetical protein